MRRVIRHTILAAALIVPAAGQTATRDIEFVAEHLPEVAMDDRYAGLPLWGVDFASSRRWSFDLQAAYATVTSGGLELDGALLSGSARRRLGERWSLGLFGFVDPLRLRASHDARPLRPLFSKSIPLALPADAVYTGLDGSGRDLGFGAALAWRVSGGRLGDHVWTGGLLWQRLSLDDYRLDYRLVSGASAGASGLVDYSADYQHVAPFVGLELPRRRHDWRFSPHVLLAVPLPRRGVVGRITGDSFDIRGDTEAAGNGAHFGDPWIALGWTVSYEPWGFSVDLGATAMQRLAEPIAHRGVESNWLLSIDWRP